MTQPTAHYRLLENLHRLERRAGALHELVDASLAAPPSEIMRVLLRKMIDRVGADAGALVSDGAEDWAVRDGADGPAEDRLSEALRALRADAAEGVAKDVLASGEPRRDDVVEESDPLRKAWSTMPTLAFSRRLTLPLVLGEERLGVLSLFRTEAGEPFDDPALDLAVSLGRQAALLIALRRARAGGAEDAGLSTALDEAKREIGRLDEERRSAVERSRALEASLEDAVRSSMEARDRARDLEADVRGLKARLREAEASSATPARAESTPLGPLGAVFQLLDPLLASSSVEALVGGLMPLAQRLVDGVVVQMFLAEPDGRLRLAGTFPVGDHGAPRGVLVERGQGLVGQVAASRAALRVKDVALDSRFSRRVDEVLGHITHSALVAPLEHNDLLVGVIEILNKREQASFSESDLTVLTSLLRPAAALLAAWQHQEAAASSWRDCVALASDVVETRSARRAGRAERLRRTVLALAEALHWDEEERRDLERAALLHNLGRLALPPELADGARPLSAEEQGLLTQVPLRSAEFLAGCKPLAGAARIVRHVLERWDGEGTPDGKKDEAIPRGSRLLAVADAWEHLRADAPGRPGLPPEQALQEIADLAGHAFDPACVEALTALHRAGRLPA